MNVVYRYDVKKDGAVSFFCVRCDRVCIIKQDDNGNTYAKCPSCGYFLRVDYEV